MHQPKARGGFNLRWVEQGAPAVSPPRVTGYGTKLITSLISHNLGGEMEQAYDTAGFALHAFIPLVSHSTPPTGQQVPVEEHHENDSSR